MTETDFAIIVCITVLAASAQWADPSLIHGFGWVIAGVSAGFYIWEASAHRTTMNLLQNDE